MRKLKEVIDTKFIEEKFDEILNEKKINRKVFLSGPTCNSLGYLDKKIKVPIRVGHSNAECSYMIFRKLSKVPLLNIEHFNYGIVLFIEYKGHLYSYLESFPNVTKWLDKHSAPIGMSTLKKLLSGVIEFKKVSIRNPKPSIFEISGLSLDGHNVKSNIGTFGKERQVIQRITSVSKRKKEALTLDFNAEKVQLVGARESINEYLLWINEISIGLSSASKTKSTTNSFFKGFMQEVSEKELKGLSAQGFYVNESILIEELSKHNCHLIYKNKKIKQNDVKQILGLFNNINTQSDFTQPIDLNLCNGSYRVNIELNLNKNNYFDIKFKKFPKISIENDDSQENLVSYLTRKEAFGISFENHFFQLGSNVFKSKSLKERAGEIAEILKYDKEISNAVCEKYVAKSHLTSSTQFPKNSLFYFVEKKLKKEGGKVFCDDLGNEWCDYLSFNNDKKTIHFVHCKYELVTSSKAYTFSASDFQVVFGQAQKNIGNIIHGHQLIKKKFEEKFTQTYEGSNITMDRNNSKSLPTTYSNQYEEIYRSPLKKIKVVIAINFISKKAFLQNLKLENYYNPYFWQQIYFIISAAEFYKQQGIEFEIWCEK
ncbi:MAG: hypothetical protein K2Q18_18835 [Bdellovibrionales bacterium]|nr:hypothetical protein [Bdellovibrionales bacterium]